MPIDSQKEFEDQARAADGQTTSAMLQDCLFKGILSEEALRDLEIKPAKKYLGPISGGTLGEIYAPRGIGKTFLRDALALCLTRNLDFGPFRSGEPAGVLVVDGEMPLPLLKERRELSKSVCEPLRKLDLISNEYLYQQGSPIINLADTLWRDAFIELVKSNTDEWDVIIFDNLSSFLPGVKENDQESWGPINNFLLQLRWMGKCAIFIHHSGKNGDQRGTSSREDALDFVMKLTLPAGFNPENGCKFDATLTKSRSLTGSEAAPFTFEIVEYPDSRLGWTVTNQRENRKHLIIALCAHGYTQKSISDLLKVDKSYVSKERSKAIKGGLLDEKGTSFTARGVAEYGHIDIESVTG